MSEVLWERKPHTGAKHDILRRYLDAWFPILASWNERVGFIDGFAGPGEYVGGEPGSPAIALEAAISHASDMSHAKLVFGFVESERPRYEHLTGLLGSRGTPPHVEWHAVHGKFDDVIDDLRTKIGVDRPMFIMIDPFGVKGVRHETIARLGGFQTTEVLISFMYESITRWLSSPEFESHLDAIFGTREWRDARDLAGEPRKKRLLDLFLHQVRRAGFRHVLHFEMFDSGNRTEYFLIFGTHHPKGLGAMKRAMWKVDGAGRFQFRDATNPNQKTLFAVEPDYPQLRQLVLDRFSGGEHSIGVVEAFVNEETAFLKTHLRRPVLVPLENEGLIEITTLRKKARTYPAGTRIRFPG